MPRITLSIAACLTLAIATANAAPQGLDFDEMFGSGNSSCSGTSLGGYCCQGSIINPSGDYMNNNQGGDYGSMTCCVGDPSHGFNNGGPSSCTAGSAVPLTEAATASAAPAGSASSAVPADNTASTSMAGESTSSSGGSGSSQATQTGTSSSSESEDSSGSSASSSGVPTQSSDGGAAQMLATMAPVVGGVMLGFAGLL